MAQAPARAASAVRLFDVHCHLQDPRIVSTAPALIRAAAASGVARFAVNGTSEVRLRLPRLQRHSHTSIQIAPC
jgi:TatD DNase family protein